MDEKEKLNIYVGAIELNLQELALWRGNREQELVRVKAIIALLNHCGVSNEDLTEALTSN